MLHLVILQTKVNIAIAFQEHGAKSTITDRNYLVYPNNMHHKIDLILFTLNPDQFYLLSLQYKLILNNERSVFNIMRNNNAIISELI